MTAFLIASFAFISSCSQEDQIVYVPREVPADCPPSAPRGVYAVNLDQFVSICWYPNPEDDIVGYDVWKNDSLYGVYEWIGEVDAESPDPYEYCFDYDEPANGEQWYYAVSAYDEAYNMSDLSYEDVSATPRPEGLLRLYDQDAQSDACGYDFSSLSNTAQDCSLISTDIAFDSTDTTKNLFVAMHVGVKIQDYGYTYSFDDINYAPDDGWSPSGTVEVIENHCYILQLGEADGLHYVKLWVAEIVPGSALFWWAYQTDPYNRDVMPGIGTDEQTDLTSASGSPAAGVKKIKEFPNGRHVPPTTISGKQDGNKILQRQNTLP